MPHTDGNEDHVLSAYQVLGLQSWCTKVDIERRFQQLRKQLATRIHIQDELDNITQAYQAIVDPQERANYDATLG